MVHIISTVVTKRERLFEAATKEDARNMAEQQDWSEWSYEETPFGETCLDWIEELP